MTLPTPLSILLEEMRRKWDAKDTEGAIALARLAAPYMHGRVKPSKAAAELSKLTDADLDELGDTGGEAAPDEGPAELRGLGGTGADAAEPQAGTAPPAADQ